MIVYTDIVGDLFHYGHINLFKKAKKYGDILYVGICTDDLVMSYKRQTILNIDERVQMIEACKYVNKVIPNCPCPITKEFIELHNINFVIRGDDMNNIDSIQKWYNVPYTLDILRFVPYTKSISTSDIIQRISNRIELNNVTKILQENDIINYDNIIPVLNGKTNKIYYIQYNDKKTVLKLFNNNPKLLFNRLFENNIMQILNKHNIAPNIINIINYGRIEEFINGIHIYDPVLYQEKIAISIKYIHNTDIVKLKPLFWDKFLFWKNIIGNKYNDKINNVINILNSFSNNYWNDIVLGHGDLSLENIFIIDDDIKFIDFEYSCFLPRGFDIANHICEYQGVIPNKLYYPNDNIRKSLISHYLLCESSNTDLKIIDLYSLISHYFWACWATILYDTENDKQYYKDYYELRFNEFNKYYDIFITN